MPISTHMKMLRLAGFLLLPLAMLPGCATQEAVSEQADSLKAQIATLNKSLNETSDLSKSNQSQVVAAKAREEALTRNLETLMGEVKALQARLAEEMAQGQQAEARLAEQAAQLAEKSLQNELRLDELATLAHDLTGQMETSSEMQGASAQQLAAIADKLSIVDQQADQADSKAIDALALGADLKKMLGETASQTVQNGERLSQLEGAQASLLKQTEGMFASMEADALKRDEAATLLAGLGERLTQDELRLNELATGLPERLAQVEAHMDSLEKLTKEAVEQAAQNEIRTKGKVAFSVVLTEDKTLYPLNLPNLASLDRAALDGLVARLKAMDKNYHLEIQGHTDNIGVDDYNYQLGMARAEVVKRYLHETGGISLSRMSVISFGATSPVDVNSRNNRRIVILALMLDEKQ